MSTPNTTPNTETRVGTRARYKDQQWLVTQTQRLGAAIENFMNEVERDGLIEWSATDTRALQTTWVALQEISHVIKEADLPED